jgi:hypothetical protein
MSFVITTISQEAVVQVSDTRLSNLADKSVLTDELRKTIIVMGTQARFVLGWVGLAKVGSHNTADWIGNRLSEMDAVNLPPEQIVANIAATATEDFAMLPVCAADRRCHFILAGWHIGASGPKPFIGVTYNDLIYHASTRHSAAMFEPAPVATAQFFHTTASFRAGKRSHYVFGIGDCTAENVQLQLKGLRGLMKKRADVKSISAACRRIALEAASHTTTISRNLISVEMNNQGEGYCSFHSEEGAEAMILPDFLSTKGLVVNPRVSVTEIAGDEISFKFRAKLARYGTEP